MQATENVAGIYQRRFAETGLDNRKRVWRTLCRCYFDKLVPADSSILDVACGYGEFINNIRAGTKYAIDMNPDSRRHLEADVRFTQTRADDLSHLPDNGLDRAFTSNFLEHLPDKAACDAVLQEVLRILKPGGRFIIMGPNIRFAYREYWDFYDHYLPLSHRSLAEGLETNGFEVVSMAARFLPYTMANKRPTHDFLIRAYLAFPPAWRIMGKQFLIVAEKPA